jgi:outer membrane protein OmpA-like peptidoglycan-associated protein
MTRLGRSCLAISLLVLAACGPKRIASPPPLPAPAAAPPSIVALLPEAGGRVGAVTVTNRAGTVELTVANTRVLLVDANTAPGAPAPIEPAEIRRLFGAALDALPPEEIVFNLYFRLGTTALAVESESVLPALLAAVRERKSTLLTVTGHTDSTGTSRDANYRLGLDRANAVGGRLRAIGVDAASIVIRSHGQDDPLVPTPVNTAEPRNRRVEVIVR